MESKSQFFSPLRITSSNGYEIAGSIYRQNKKTIIISNMDTNDSNEWNALVDILQKHGYTILLYTYNRKENDCFYDLSDVMNYVKQNISNQFILVGASRGGVISLKSAINSNFKDSISAVISMSAPQVYEGEIFYSDDDLKKINTPVFLINSEFDDAVSDTKKMFEMITAKKDIMICSGSRHGTEIFNDNKDILLKSIEEFILSIL